MVKEPPESVVPVVVRPVLSKSVTVAFAMGEPSAATPVIVPLMVAVAVKLAVAVKFVPLRSTDALGDLNV
jgi:hypothetical protein